MTNSTPGPRQGKLPIPPWNFHLYSVGFAFLSFVYIRRLLAALPPHHWRPAILASLCLLYSLGMTYRIKWCYHLLLLDQVRMLTWSTLLLIAKLLKVGNIRRSIRQLVLLVGAGVWSLWALVDDDIRVQFDHSDDTTRHSLICVGIAVLPILVAFIRNVLW